MEWLRALEELRQKYDDREECVSQQLRELQEQFLQLHTRLSATAITPCGKSPVKATADSHCGPVETPRTTEVSSVCHVPGPNVTFSTGPTQGKHNHKLV